MMPYWNGLRAHSVATLRFHLSNTPSTTSNTSSTTSTSSSGGTPGTPSNTTTSSIGSNTQTYALPWTSVSISVPVFLVVALTVLVVTCCGAVAIVMVTCCGARRRDTVAEGGDARWLPGVGIIDYVPASNRSSVRTSVILCDSDPGGCDGPPSQEPSEDSSTVFNIRLPISSSAHPPHSYNAQQTLQRERTQSSGSLTASLRSTTSLVAQSTSLVLDPLRPYVRHATSQDGAPVSPKTLGKCSERETLLEGEGSPMSPRESDIGTVKTVRNDTGTVKTVRDGLGLKSSSSTETPPEASEPSPGRSSSHPSRNTLLSSPPGITSRATCHTYRLSSRPSSSKSSPSPSRSSRKTSPLASPRLVTSSSSSPSQHPSDVLGSGGEAKKEEGSIPKEDVILPLRRDLETFAFRSLSIPALGEDLESSGRPVRHSSSGVPLEWVRIVNY
ncbi:uncharacterized protein LOC143038941 [Oratosquilla oratoria]|uniref:uncharacterized protein LOC143038941 n=1 Tax=Oratosquilla oratoria TaxID=337810 RepID=UPI003F77372B